MLTRAWAQIRCYPRRLVAVLLAIVIGVGFTAATVVFSSTVSAGLSATVGAQASRADVVISQPDDMAATLAAARRVDGVRLAEPLYDTGINYASRAAKGSARLGVIAAEPQLRWFGMAQGRLPTDAGQIVIDRTTAEQANLTIGSKVTLSGWDEVTTAVRVSGITDRPASSLTGGLAQFYGSPELFAALGLTTGGTIAVLDAPGASAETVRDSLSAALGEDLTVSTGAERAAEQVRSMTGKSDAIGLLLIGFAVIAMVVAAIVIATTFTILLTQRRRELALLRCVGASARQVRREVLLEGLLLGIGGSAVGIAVGIGVGDLAARLTDTDGGGLSIKTPYLVGVFVIGVAVTVLAAAWPAAKAMRVPPLAALRPATDAPDEASERSTGRIRVWTGTLLTLAGAAVLAYGAAEAEMSIAMGGGILSAVGVLMLTRSALPGVLAILTPLARTGGVPGRMAADNTRRNPGRSAGTSAALLVGVALIVTLQVGAASASATLNNELAGRYPVDVAIADVTGQPLPRSVIDAVADSGVQPAPVAGVMARITPQAPGSDEVLVLAPSAQALAVARGAQPPDQDTVLVPPWWTANGLSAGSTLNLSVGGTSRKFTVEPGHLADTGGGSTVVISPAALRELAPDATTVGLWALLPESASASAVTAALQRATAELPTVEVTGSALQRASTEDALGTMLTMATALLAVAVLIAIVGIGNTLGLSVLERTRESALLRTLGLQRRQLHRMIAVEALLLAAVGALAGIALGIGYGIAGAMATVGSAGRAAVIAVPWGQLGIVLAVAMVAGLLASVLPARRATKVLPAVALAQA